MVQVTQLLLFGSYNLLAVLTTRASRALFLTDRFPYQVTMLKPIGGVGRGQFTVWEVDSLLILHGGMVVVVVVVVVCVCVWGGG